MDSLEMIKEIERLHEENHALQEKLEQERAAHAYTYQLLMKTDRVLRSFLIVSAN